MNEDQVHSPNQGDTVPPQQTTSPKTNGSAYAWVLLICIVIVIVLFGYWLYSNLSSTTLPSDQANLDAPEAPVSDEQGVITEKPLANEEVTPDTPPQLWASDAVTLDMKDIVNVGITRDHGRILIMPQDGAGLYVHTENNCTDNCLDSWTPYLSESEFTSGDLSTEYRSDLSSFQYTWKGQGLNTFNGDTLRDKYQGISVSESWQLARP